ncbi:MAG: hypothetical protein ACYCX3_15650 [Thermoleophilia bacterium]
MPSRSSSTTGEMASRNEVSIPNTDSKTTGLPVSVTSRPPGERVSTHSRSERTTSKLSPSATPLR